MNLPPLHRSCLPSGTQTSEPLFSPFILPVLPTQLICLLISASLGDSGAHTLFPWIWHTDPPSPIRRFCPWFDLVAIRDPGFHMSHFTLHPCRAQVGARGANMRVKMPRGPGLAGPPVARRELAVPPAGRPFDQIQRINSAGRSGREAGGTGGLRHLLSPAHRGPDRGRQQHGKPAVARPPCSATCCQAGPSSRTGSPTTESNLRLLVAKGLEWRVDNRKCLRVITLCTRPFLILHGGEGTWC